ncbi:hypothetical protein TIFTF001_014005 [Ficus carica]|uniref:Uncharacterized protein n=1 Tax=Ficus carica TaxID=3494 RepID=A0AA88AF95_FICCA|nr:hypothetical protein TIFTF001_014005 [Ficus carica]
MAVGRKMKMAKKIADDDLEILIALRVSISGFEVLQGGDKKESKREFGEEHKFIYGS